MKVKAIEKQQGENAYLKTAPETLIRFYNPTMNGAKIMERLLTKRQMAEAWEILSSHINANEERAHRDSYGLNPYHLLWGEIGTTLLNSRRAEKTKEEIDFDLKKIEQYATDLRNAIIDPDRTDRRWSRTAAPKTGARFDYLYLYNYFPAEVMKLNMQCIPLQDDAWEKADVMERWSIADRLLRIWPHLSEVLDELIAKVRQERKKEKERVRPVTRDRKTSGGASNKKERYFVVQIAHYLERTFQLDRKTESIPVTAAIAAAVFNQKVLHDFVGKALKPKKSAT